MGADDSPRVAAKVGRRIGRVDRRPRLAVREPARVHAHAGAVAKPDDGVTPSLRRFGPHSVADHVAVARKRGEVACGQVTPARIVGRERESARAA